MSKLFSGWRAQQGEKVVQFIDERDRQVSRMAYEVAVLRERVRSLTESKKRNASLIKKLRAENARLKEPFIAAMSVAGESNGR